MSAAPTFRESAATAEAAQAGLLYERYARQLLGFCRARLSSREEAEDAVQQTFLNAHRSLRGGTVPRAEAAWMFAIAANVCRERRRSAWRRSRVEVVSDDGLVGDRAAPEHSHEELTGVADALAELTPNQRRAILMREWQGLSYREIAAELSLSEGAVETLIFRARRSLARKLDRSRGRVWGISNLGSALAWGKAALSGGAAQVAAATLVVTAGVTAASPFVLLHGSQRPATVAIRRVGERRGQALQFARTSRGARGEPTTAEGEPARDHRTRRPLARRTIRSARPVRPPRLRRRSRSSSPCHPQRRPSPSAGSAGPASAEGRSPAGPAASGGPAGSAAAAGERCLALPLPPLPKLP